MNKDDVLQRIAEIRRIAGDYEAAHSEEDDLHRAVLLAIATGDTENSQEIAAAALTTQDIEFSRYCA